MSESGAGHTAKKGKREMNGGESTSTPTPTKKKARVRKDKGSDGEGTPVKEKGKKMEMKVEEGEGEEEMGGVDGGAKIEVERSGDGGDGWIYEDL